MRGEGEVFESQSKMVWGFFGGAYVDYPYHVAYADRDGFGSYLVWRMKEGNMRMIT